MKIVFHDRFIKRLIDYMIENGQIRFVFELIHGINNFHINKAELSFCKK